MKDIELIKGLLLQASELFERNVDKADNYDCEIHSQLLDNIILHLNEIGDFEVYED